jgi:hypothetical protein
VNYDSHATGAPRRDAASQIVAAQFEGNVKMQFKRIGLAVVATLAMGLGAAAYHFGFAKPGAPAKPRNDAGPAAVHPVRDANAFAFVNTERLVDAISADRNKGRRMLREFIGDRAPESFEESLSGRKPRPDASEDRNTGFKEVDQWAYCIHDDGTLAVLRLRASVSPEMLAAAVAKRNAVKKPLGQAAIYELKNPLSFVWMTSDGRVVVDSTSEKLLLRYVRHAEATGSESLNPGAMAAARGADAGAEFFADAQVPLPKHVLTELAAFRPGRAGAEPATASKDRRQPDPWAEAVQGIKRIELQVNRTADVPVRLTVVADTDEHARRIETELGRWSEAVRGHLRDGGKRRPKPDSRFPVAEWEKTLTAQIVGGLNVERSGTTVVWKLRHAGGLPRLLEFALREATRTAESAAARFKDISDQLK